MIALLPFTVQSDVDAALSRHANFMRKWSSISVDIRCRSTVVPGEGLGRLILARPNKTSFQMEWSSGKYGFWQSDRRVVEADHTRRRYRDFMTFPSWAIPPGVLSGIPDHGFPAILLNPDLRKASGFGSFRLLPQTRGVRTVGLAAKQQVMGGVIDYQFKFDEFGRPLHIRMNATPVTGPFQRDYYFSNWIVDRAFPPATFAGTLPSGYTADALPREPMPLGVGSTFPLTGWTAFGSSSSEGFKLARGAIIVVASKDSLPCRGLIAALKAQSSKVGAPVYVVWNGARGDAKGFPDFHSASGTAAGRLGLSSLPMTYLVRERGAIQKLWLGFDASRPDDWIADVAASVRARS